MEEKNSTINIKYKKREKVIKKPKKKHDKRILIIIVLILIMIALTISYYNPKIWTQVASKFSGKTKTSSSSTSESSTTTENVEAETKTIMNTISSSGEIKTTFEEKLELHTTYYFSEIYVEKNQYIEAGTKILKYTNGTYLTAPCNCVVTEINIPDSGSLCTSQHYITIEGTDTLTTTVSVSEDKLSKVSIGQEAQITVEALNKTYTGYVTNINSTATYSSSGSKFAVTIEFQNDSKALIGMTGKTDIILEKAENAVVVPTEAVTTSNGTKTVTVVKSDGTTEKTKVETGISNDAYIVIKSGITSGTTVQITKTTSTTSNFMSQMMQMQENSGGQRTQRQSSSGSGSSNSGEREFTGGSGQTK